MRFGENEIEVGVLDADKTIALIKFITHVVGETGEKALSWGAFLNILSPQHLYDLTSIITGLSREVVKEHWTFALFVEMTTEVAEENDLSVLLGNLQRVVDAFRG